MARIFAPARPLGGRGFQGLFRRTRVPSWGGMAGGGPGGGLRDLLAMGPNSLLVTSEDGKEWTEHSHSFNSSILDVTYDNGMFVACGFSGHIYTSTDGLSWTTQTTPVTDALRGVRYGNGIWVACGNSGRILTSPDAITWTSQTTPGTQVRYGVAFHDGQFLVVGQNGSFLVSTDGVNWTNHSPISIAAVLYDVIHDGSRWIAAADNGRLWYSEDATDWNVPQIDLPTSAVIESIGFNGSRYVVCGRNNDIATSTDLENWTVPSVPQETPSATYQKVIWNGSLWVVVGNFSPVILTSPDGLTWDLEDVESTWQLAAAELFP